MILNPCEWSKFTCQLSTPIWNFKKVRDLSHLTREWGYLAKPKKKRRKTYKRLLLLILYSLFKCSAFGFSSKDMHDRELMITELTQYKSTFGFASKDMHDRQLMITKLTQYNTIYSPCLGISLDEFSLAFKSSSLWTYLDFFSFSFIFLFFYKNFF